MAMATTMVMTTMLVQPVSSLAFEFTGTETEFEFMFDDNNNDDALSSRGGSEEKCRSISKYYL